MEKLLVFTDLHIVEDGRTIAGLDPFARLQATLEHALARHGDARRIIVMGDLAHEGKRKQYARLAALLQRVHLPVTLMLGNHDRRDRFLEAFPETAVDGEGFVQSVTDLDRHRIITLDTLEGPPWRRDAHGGVLGEARIAFLRQALETSDDRLPLVFTHHPAAKVGIGTVDEIRLADGREVLDLLAAHPGAHLFSGHVHRTISGSARGVPFTIFKSTCHQLALGLGAEDTGTFTDAPGGYGVIVLRKTGVTAHFEDVGRKVKEFDSDAASPT
ncbi:metallophosphoesterase [Pelagovum pacificum]|nr:metallophosphoesterase [Pelagovum pacificum]QQA44037.1 metallophosphoesterase [Pelagovum pacificum]